MNPSFSTSRSILDTLAHFCSSLNLHERKCLITLSRSQHIPDPAVSPVLFEKVKPILDKLVSNPPYLPSDVDNFTDIGHLVKWFLSSPLTTALLLVYALGVEVTDEMAEEGRMVALMKEYMATQSVRKPSEWNWNLILGDRSFGDIVHPLFPSLSPIHRQFQRDLSLFRQRSKYQVIFPHYTTRGVSSETAHLLIDRVYGSRIQKVHGNRRSFHRHLNRGNVTSRDIVHHYVRTGEWIFGRTQLKQRWYPSQLLPRTYFSWGGCDIAIAGYLREFFNNLADVFEPTQRKNRVQPDWLQRSKSDSGFQFYDLTSFTSWFHEHVPFLHSLARFFKNTPVYLVGENLTLSDHSIGSLIEGYIEYCNDFPEFCIAEKLVPYLPPASSFRHLCAGFLGVPGNLITCTLPHGLAQATIQRDVHSLQVPGDDVGQEFVSENHRIDGLRIASSLGSLQFEKVFSLPEDCLYLKRLVLDLGDKISLSPMLIHPLLPYLVNPTSPNLRSNRYRLPDRRMLRSRAAHVLVSYHRDIWRLTKGELSSDIASILLLFSRRIHQQVGLPFNAIFQGREYGETLSENGTFSDITLKFSVVDDDMLQYNPDIVFAGKYVDRMVIRLTNEEELSIIQSDMLLGERYIVKKGRVWRFLEDMGYVKEIGIPGEKVVLIGADARDAFLFATEPPLREIEVVSDIELHQLASLGIVSSDVSTGFFTQPMERRNVFDSNSRSWRYRKYVDLDDPKAASYFSSRDWVGECLERSRSSLSPEPVDSILDY